MINFSSLFYLLLFKPIFNLLVVLYNVFPYKDFGVAVIFLTIIIKMVIFPLTLSSNSYQKKMLLIEPQIKKLQEKIKKQSNPEEQKKLMQEMLQIYKKEKVNPFFSIFPSIFQAFFFIALFLVFKSDFSKNTLSANLYPFVKAPSSINFYFLNIFNLTEPNIILAILASFFQYIQIKTAMPLNETKEDFTVIFQKQMLIMMPLFTFLILFKLPSVLGLYWLVLSLVSILEERFLIKNILKKYERK